MMRDSPKVFLPSFKTVRYSWRNIFFQKSDGRRRSMAKEDFLESRKVGLGTTVEYTERKFKPKA